MVKTRRERRGPHEARAPEASPPPPDVSTVEQCFVDDLMALAVSMAPEFAEHAARYGEEVRRRWGGDRPYIAHRRDISERDAAIRRDYLMGARFAALVDKYQLSVRQIIRVVKAAR